MYSNNIVNFQEFTTILNANTIKKAGNLLNAPRMTPPHEQDVRQGQLLFKQSGTL